MKAPRRLALLVPASVLIVCSLVVLFAALLAPRRERIAKLEAAPGLEPRLASILAAKPLPEGWSGSEAGGSYELKLEALPAEAPLPNGAYDFGFAHRAAAVGLGDERYSVSKAEAEALGPEDLAKIEPPRRALAVEGLWPGEKGYALDERLVLSIRPVSFSSWRALPAELCAWADAASEAARSAPGNSSPCTLVAAGDLQVGRAQWKLLSSGEAGLEELLGPEVLADLRSGTVAVANLESAISSGGEPNPDKRFRFLMPPGSASALSAAGLDLVLLANNHGLDFGEGAFVDTLGELDRSGPAYVGAGRSLADAAAPRYVCAPSERLAFVGYAFFPRESLGYSLTEAAAGVGKPGISAELEAALASVREAAAAGATVVVLAHGGAEYQASPDASARDTYSRFVDAGAALVVGSHPHILQGCEARSGSLIAYSMGNFLFTDEDEPVAARRSAVIDFLIFEGKARGLRLLPIIVDEKGTRADPDASGARRRFSEACAKLAALRPRP